MFALIAAPAKLALGTAPALGQICTLGVPDSGLVKTRILVMSTNPTLPTL